MAARIAGATTIIAVDLNEERLALAREFGATLAFNPQAGSPTDAILAATGAGVNFALDTTGIPAVIRQAVDALAPRGTCGIVGAGAAGSEVRLDMINIMTAGRSLRGIVEGDAVPQTFIPALIDLYRDGRFPFDRLVTFYSFAELNAAIRDSENGSVVKAVVRMNHSS